ncbi:MAG: hypothetical protein HY897_14685 [Deltaproteobacteria bacterium]|nr:hypothetical protein [Deltaproteobacteria bacterium]
MIAQKSYVFVTKKEVSMEHTRLRRLVAVFILSIAVVSTGSSAAREIGGKKLNLHDLLDLEHSSGLQAKEAFAVILKQVEDGIPACTDRYVVEGWQKTALDAANGGNDLFRVRFPKYRNLDPFRRISLVPSVRQGSEA